MKTMTMEKAVEYCKTHRVAVHLSTQEVFNKFMAYLDNQDIEPLKEYIFDRYGDKTGSCLSSCPYYAMYAYIDWYRDKGYEIIELVDEPVNDDTLIITIKSDGYKVVSASCHGITVEAKCNDTDTFNLSKGSHIALKRLIDRMNEPVKEEPKFKVGDIVEIISNSICAWDESIGLQGIITNITRDYFTVTFPVKICDFYDWNYLSKDLKLICKAQ